MSGRVRTKRWVAGIAAAWVALGAGAGFAQTPQGATSSPGNTIVIDGSSTVEPLTSAIAEEFAKVATGRGVRVTVGTSGTGGGFKKFCADQASARTDISNASRPIQATEHDECQRARVSYFEIPVAIDGLSVVVSRNNAFASCLTVGELRRMWEPTAERRITSWRQIRRTFPDTPIRLAGAGADSGTFDTFTEVVNGRAKASRGDYLATEDDNVTVQFIQREQNGLGYFGLAYLEENLTRVKAVNIDPSVRADLSADGECQGVEPTFENVLAGRYRPLTRPLFIYPNRTSWQTKPEVQRFVQYYIGPDGLRHQVDDPRKRGSKTPLVRAVGYVEFPNEIYQLAATCLQRQVLGSRFQKDGKPAGHASVGEVVAGMRQACR